MAEDMKENVKEKPSPVIERCWMARWRKLRPFLRCRLPIRHSRHPPIQGNPKIKVKGLRAHATPGNRITFAGFQQVNILMTLLSCRHTCPTRQFTCKKKYSSAISST